MSHVKKGFDSYNSHQSRNASLTPSEKRETVAHNIEVLLSMRNQFVAEIKRDQMEDQTINACRSLECSINE